MAQLLPQDSVLLAEVVDCELLLFVHPAGHCDQQKPERVENSGRRQSALSQSNEQLPVFGRYAVASLAPAETKCSYEFAYIDFRYSWEITRKPIDLIDRAAGI